MGAYVYATEQAETQSRLDRKANTAVVRLESRLLEHQLLLEATRALFASGAGTVDEAMFRRFISQIDLDQRYNGIQGVGYAARINIGQEAFLAAYINKAYGINRAIWPGTKNAERTVVTLLEPANSRNRAALSYDMMSEAARREAIIQAGLTGEAQATAPVILKQEITQQQQAGFLIYLPMYRGTVRLNDEEPHAYVYAPFRAGDLVNAAMISEDSDPLNISMRLADSQNANLPLYENPNFKKLKAGGKPAAKRTLSVFGRKWELEVISNDIIFNQRPLGLAVLVTGFSLLLAFAIWMFANARTRESEQSLALAEISQRHSEEQELYLHEMGHRIKNSIARILAISRFTVREADDLPQYEERFSKRLQAMANAQNLLTQSRMDGAYLNELLIQELSQLFGERAALLMDGPPVLLARKAVQSLGLVFHELATNMLKYGALDEDLSVKWFNEYDESGLQMLVIHWHEVRNKSKGMGERQGFGSRLIETTIRMDLRGQIERHFGDDGLLITIRLPVKFLVADGSG